MSRWIAFHAPVHSAAFAMDRQFCRREMDDGVKKDIWSVMKDFSKAPGGKDLSKMKSTAVCYVWQCNVRRCCGLQAGDTVIHNHSSYTY